MNKCFFTKLMGTVNNNELPVLGHINLKFSKGNTEDGMYLQTTEALSVKSFSNEQVEYLYTNGESIGTTYTSKVNYPQAVIVSTSTGAHVLIPKDKIVCIGGYNKSIDIDLLKYLPYVKSIKGAYYGVLNSINGKNISEISFENSGELEGNVNDTNFSSGLTSLIMEECRLITGSISKFKSMTKLTDLCLRGTQITGTWEEFVAGQVSAGRNSCNNLSISNVNNGKVTFDGEVNTQGSLSWSQNPSNNNYIDVTIGTKTITIDSSGKKIS